MDGQKYQLFPELSAEEYAELKGDIEARGVQVAVEYDEGGDILDGHHRVKACMELRIANWPKVVRKGLSEEEKLLHVRRLNLARRQLTKEQRAEVMRQMRKEGMTTTAIAKEVGVSRETVRVETKAVSQNLQTVTGSDGKSYPASKPRADPPPRPTPPEPAKVNGHRASVAPEPAVIPLPLGKPPIESPGQEASTGPSMTTQRKQIQSSFCNALRDLCGRVFNIRDQFGSAAAMFESDLWAGADVNVVATVIHGVREEFQKLDDEVQAYVKAKKSKAKLAK